MPTRSLDEAKVILLAKEVAAQALRAAAAKVRAKRESNKTWSQGGWYDTEEDRARHAAVNEAIEGALDEVVASLEETADELAPDPEAS